MARLYILTEEQIKSGKRPKTPRQKQLWWKQVCIVLSFLIVVEHLALLYFKVR
jgi:hypothetical protein